VKDFGGKGAEILCASWRSSRITSGGRGRTMRTSGLARPEAAGKLRPSPRRTWILCDPLREAGSPREVYS